MEELSWVPVSNTDAYMATRKHITAMYWHEYADGKWSVVTFFENKPLTSYRFKTPGEARTYANSTVMYWSELDVEEVRRRA